MIRRASAGFGLGVFVSVMGAIGSFLLGSVVGAAVLGLSALVLSCVWLVYLYTQYSSSGILVSTTDRQLGKEEARKLLRYHLMYDRGVRISEVYDSGTSVENARGDDNIRVYILKARRMNRDSFVGVVADLEKEISISDPEDPFEAEKAVNQFDNMRFVQADTLDELDEKVKKIKEEVGKSLIRMQTFRSYDEEGNLVKETETPALPRNDEKGLPEEAEAE